MNYVDQYLKLDNRASDAESKADEYRKRSEDTRWEQCRIAYDAVSTGQYTQQGFADAVSKNVSNISRQRRMWERFAHAQTRPRYCEAMALVEGAPSLNAANQRKMVRSAKAVINNDDLLAELIADDDVVAALFKALSKRGADGKSAARANLPKDPENWTPVQWETFDKRVSHAAELILDAVLFRRNGWYVPSVESIASLNLVRREDVDAELAALVGEG